MKHFIYVLEELTNWRPISIVTCTTVLDPYLISVLCCHIPQINCSKEYVRNQLSPNTDLNILTILDTTFKIEKVSEDKYSICKSVPPDINKYLYRNYSYSTITQLVNAVNTYSRFRNTLIKGVDYPLDYVFKDNFNLELKISSIILCTH